MNIIKTTGHLFILFLSINVLAADKPNTVDIEIQHLIGFVQQSGCDFIRNGTKHRPDKAIEHISTKYDYFRKKIDSAETFIALTATQSTMTKNKYKIQCQNEEAIYSSAWLLAELASFRRIRNTEDVTGL